MKYVYLYVISILFFTTLCTHTSSVVVTTKSKLHHTNIIGISGASATEPYVEIVYSMGDGQGGNKTESVKISPPHLFENRNVYITYDSIITIVNDKKNYSYSLRLQHNYEEGGSEYFRIINHSTDKPIEFFIAGGQDMEVDPAGNVTTYPSVYFRKAPIRYLLRPEQKPARNAVFYGEKVYFEGNRCGDIELTSAWSVDDVMKLYRAEYNRSPDTLLYVDMRTIGNNGRMTNPPKYDQRLKDKIFYGTIAPQSQIKGEDIWLLATPWIYDDDLVMGEVF